MTKKIFDPVHGFIHFKKHESDFIHTKPFQRLYSINQLGAAYLVYPGATHKRFEHSIGTMKIASKIYDSITRKRGTFLPQPGSEEHKYWRNVVRLASLAHDLGHLPFSHTAEHLLIGEGGHEKWTELILRSEMLKDFWKDFDPKFQEDVIKTALSPEHYHGEYSPLEKIMTEIVTGDLFGADRIDYLLRDAKGTGLAYGHFDHSQLIQMLDIVYDPETSEPFLGVKEHGIESCESLLISRYFMHKRLCQYPSVKAYTFHMSRLIKSYFEEHELLKSVESFVHTNDHHVLADVYMKAREGGHPRSFDAQRITKEAERFKALRIPDGIEKEYLQSVAQELEIPDQMFGWDFHSSEKGDNELSYPYRRREEADISFQFAFNNWVFVHPTFEKALQKRL